jgi:hypothetical protein
MSSKIDKDQEIDLNGGLEVEVSSEEIAELLFTRAINTLSWADLLSCNYVCKGWSRFISGPLVAHPAYAKRFKEVHTEPEVRYCADRVLTATFPFSHPKGTCSVLPVACRP